MNQQPPWPPLQPPYGQPPWGQQTPPQYSPPQRTNYGQPQYGQPPRSQQQPPSPPSSMSIYVLTQQNPNYKPVDAVKKGIIKNKFRFIPLWIFILVIILLIPILANASMETKSNAGTSSFKTSSRTSIASGVGKTLQTFFSPNGATSTACLKWSPDGSTLRAVRMNGTVQIWDTASWQNTLTYEIPSNVLMAVAWSPMGDYFATASLVDTEPNAVRVWNTMTGENVLTYYGHSSEVMALAWSPDGKYIASGGFDKTVQVWSATTGETLLTYRGHTGDVVSIAWSPDGKRIASAGDDKTVQIWDAATRNRIVTYHGHKNGAWRVAWSPDGTKLASSDYVNFKDELKKMKETTVQVWNASTGARIVTYRGHIGMVHTLMWSPDGQRIASAGDDKTVQIWNAASGVTIFTYHKHSSPVSYLSWSPDGSKIASADNGDSLIWQAV